MTSLRRGRKARYGAAAVGLAVALLATVIATTVGPAQAAEDTTDSRLAAAVAQLESCRAMRAEAENTAERAWGNTCIRLAQRVVDGLTPDPGPDPTPTASPTVSPTPTPSPTVTATPPPPAPSGCALPLYPTAACTGVPAGWTPTRVVSGDYTTRAAGEVIDGWRVTGSINVVHSNVVVRNSEVYGRIYNQVSGVAYNGLLVEDVTIGPPSGNSGATTGAIGVCGYTARRVHIRNAPEGFRVGGYGYSGRQCGPVVLEHNYMRLIATGCDHSDGVQEYDGPPGTIIRHNTIDMRGVGCSTAPIYLGDYGGVVVDNLIMGGSYTLRLHRWEATARYPLVAGNMLVDGAWDYGPAMLDTCSIIDAWRDNSVVRIDDAYRIVAIVRRLTNCTETAMAGGSVFA